MSYSVYENVKEVIDGGGKVIPLYGIGSDNSCSCGKVNCPHPGKHPTTKTGLKEASLKLDQIDKWFKNVTNINYGIVLDKKILVVDIDPRNGGQESIDEFEKQHGVISSLLEVKTGGGGKHIFLNAENFSKDIKIKNARDFMKGVDLKTCGGYVVGPGSKHKSGKFYQQITKDKIEHFDFKGANPVQIANQSLADLIIEKCTARTSKNSLKQNGNNVEKSLVDGKIPEGGRNSTLHILASTLRWKGFYSDKILKLLNIVNFELCEPPLNESEIQSISNSVSKYNRGPETSKPVFDPKALCFYGPLGETALRASEHTEAHPMGILLQLLVYCGSAMGSNIKITIGNNSIPANLYVILVGESSIGRKGTSLKVSKIIAQEFIDDQFFKNIKTGLSSGEGIIHNLRDKREGFNEKNQHVVFDIGVSDKRLLAIEPEMAKIFKLSRKEANILSPILRDAWDGNPLRTLTKNQPDSVKNPHVSIIAHITPCELKTEMRNNDVHNGMANRFIWGHVERTKLLPFGGSPIEFLVPAEKLKNIFKLSSKPIDIQLSEEAKSVWEKIYYKYAEKDNRANGAIDAILARATDQIQKFALIYAMADKASEIMPIHLEAADSLWDYCQKSVHYIFEDSKDIVKNDYEQKILDALSLRDLSRTDIRDLTNRNWDVEKTELLKNKWIQENKITVTQKDRTEFWSKKADNNEK